MMLKLTLGRIFPPIVRMGDVYPMKSEQRGEVTSKAEIRNNTSGQTTRLRAKCWAEKQENEKVKYHAAQLKIEEE